ncbi:MAG: hypothetical protein AAF694_06710 [Bacteroidota bacterium]
MKRNVLFFASWILTSLFLLSVYTARAQEAKASAAVGNVSDEVSVTYTENKKGEIVVTGISCPGDKGKSAFVWSNSEARKLREEQMHELLDLVGALGVAKGAKEKHWSEKGQDFTRFSASPDTPEAKALCEFAKANR